MGTTLPIPFLMHGSYPIDPHSLQTPLIERADQMP